MILTKNLALPRGLPRMCKDNDWDGIPALPQKKHPSTRMFPTWHLPLALCISLVLHQIPAIGFCFGCFAVANRRLALQLGQNRFCIFSHDCRRITFFLCRKCKGPRRVTPPGPLGNEFSQSANSQACKYSVASDYSIYHRILKTPTPLEQLSGLGPFGGKL